MVKICFIDKDGVINKLVNHDNKMTAPWNLSEVEYFPDVDEFIYKIKDMGFVTCIVTNQPDFGFAELTDFNSKNDQDILNEILENVQSKYLIDYVIVNHVRNTDYYKPNCKSLKTLIKSLDSDKDHCYFIGDTWKDIVCAHNAEVDSIFVKRDKEYDSGPTYKVQPTYTVNDLNDAFEIIKEIEYLKCQSI